MEGAWLLGHVSGLGALGSLGWEALSLVGPDSVDSAGKQRGAAGGAGREAWGGRVGGGGSPRSPASEPGFQESLGRHAGGGSVPSVWSWWVRLVSVGGRASGETACVYVRKRRPRFGAITAACEVKSTRPSPSAQAGCSASRGARSLEPRRGMARLQGRAPPGCGQQCFLRAGGRLAVPPSLRRLPASRTRPGPSLVNTSEVFF